MTKKYKIIITLAILSTVLFFNLAGETAKAGLLTSKLTNLGEEAGFADTEPSLALQIGKVIRPALAMLGVVFMILIIYAGYLWMIARGNEEEVSKAKKIIQGSVIGLIIVIAAYAIAFLLTLTLSYNTSLW